MNATLLKGLRVMAAECRYGTTLLGNRRGLRERTKLNLVDAGYIAPGATNPGLYFITPAGWAALEAHKERA